MTKSAVTVSLVEQARGGPFVYWDDLLGSARKAKELGFDAIEIFAPGPEAVDVEALRTELDSLGLGVAAVGTGAGWVIHRKSLTSSDASARADAKTFIKSIIDMGGPFGAPAIIGSMQGQWGGDVDQETGTNYLAEGLNELGDYAKQYNVPLIYEPLNRYETNFCKTMAEGVEPLNKLSTDNVTLLADLFHMNIEEVDSATAIREAGSAIGHVHFVDSNRQAAGRGHIDFEPIAAALKETGYSKYLSAEALAVPDSDVAAATTIESYRKYFG